MVNISKTMKSIDVVYQPSVFGHDHYAVIMKNGDVYNSKFGTDVCFYVGQSKHIPRVMEGRRINKSILSAKLKRAIAEASEQSNQKTLIGHRLERQTRSGRAGTFYTISPQDRGDKPFKLKFKNLLEIPQDRVSAFEGLPAEYLASQWFPYTDWRYEAKKHNVETGHAMDILVAREAKKRGYDGIKYGNLEIQDLKLL